MEFPGLPKAAELELAHCHTRPVVFVTSELPGATPTRCPALLIFDPTIDLFGVKAPIVSDAKSRNPVLSQQAIDRRRMHAQIASHLRNRQDGRHGLTLGHSDPEQSSIFGTPANRNLRARERGRDDSAG